MTMNMMMISMVMAKTMISMMKGSPSGFLINTAILRLGPTEYDMETIKASIN